MRESELAKRLWPYLLEAVREVAAAEGAISASNQINSGAAGVHDLGGAYHTGTLRADQMPLALLRDGSRSLTGNMTMTPGVKIDGMDPSVHILDVNAHHNQIHSIIGSDHTVTGPKYGVVGMTATDTLGVLESTSDAFAKANTLLRSSADYGLGLQYLRAERITSLGDLALEPAGGDVLPKGHIQIDLGDHSRMWRTLFVAEIYAQTLVAQDVLATIGGRVMVAPTTKLSVAVNTTATTFTFDHNIFLNGDYAFMQAAPGGIPQIEAVRITSNATVVSGQYRYNVQRSVDGTLPNSWLAGDAVVNLGGNTGRGAGYIDLTSTQTIHQHLGPTITIYERLGSTAWNHIAPTVSVGNLESFVDYGVKTMGIAIGNDLTLQPAQGFQGLTGDYTNGIRLFSTRSESYNGAILTYLLEPHGDLLIGSNLASVSTTSLAVFSKARTYNGAAYEDGDIIQGNVAGANLFWDRSEGKFKFRQGTTVRALINTDGTIQAADGRITLADNEITMLATDATNAPKIQFRNSGGTSLGYIQPQDINGTFTMVINGTTKVNSAASVVGEFSALSKATFDNFGAWTDVSGFGSGWANIGGAFRVAGYRKVGDTIDLRGAIKRSSGTGVTLLTLPSGHRPDQQEPFDVQIFSTGAGYRMGRVDVRTDGVLELISDGGNSTVEFLWLSGIHFSVL